LTTTTIISNENHGHEFSTKPLPRKSALHFHADILMVNDRLDHLLTYVANFELSPHLSSGPITLIWMSIGQAILFAIGHITRQFDRNTDHVHVMHCAPRSPPAAEVALACARVVAPSSLTARRHKCSSICYSHHRLPVDVQRGEHARGQRQCRTARRSRLATPITVNAAGGARLLQRPPAVNWARPPCTCTLPVQSVPAQLELVPARSPPGCPLKAGTRGRARAQGATTYALTG
jgi:hypothetical protein